MSAPATSRMPAVFLGHGNPMNALVTNRYTAAWRRFGETVPHPRAILVVSAHWYVNATAVTAMPRPRTIHDFYGFPQTSCSRSSTRRRGCRSWPRRSVTWCTRRGWVPTSTRWGIDHGTWSVLVHAFPRRRHPRRAASLNADRGFDYTSTSDKLAPLRDRGVLIVGSGNIVHNLGGDGPADPDDGFDWAQRFDDAAKERMLAPDWTRRGSTRTRLPTRGSDAGPLPAAAVRRGTRGRGVRRRGAGRRLRVWLAVHDVVLRRPDAPYRNGRLRPVAGAAGRCATGGHQHLNRSGSAVGCQLGQQGEDPPIDLVADRANLLDGARPGRRAASRDSACPGRPGRRRRSPS